MSVKYTVSILAGGRGRRMGFLEKPLLKICGKRIIERIVGELKDLRIFIVCRRDNAEIYEKFGEVVIDELELGPIGGIYTALRKGSTVVIGGDMPFVKAEVVKFLYDEGVKRSCDALIPIWSDGKKEPLLAYYSSSAIEAFEEAISEKKLKIMSAVEKMKKVEFIRVETIRTFDENLVSFFNVNTLKDLKRAEEICSSMGMVGE